jgi:hypothetical protein
LRFPLNLMCYSHTVLKDTPENSPATIRYTKCPTGSPGTSLNRISSRQPKFAPLRYGFSGCYPAYRITTLFRLRVAESSRAFGTSQYQAAPTRAALVHDYRSENFCLTGRQNESPGR